MSLYYDWDEVFGWIGQDEGYDYSPAGALGYLPRCLNSPVVMDMMTHYLTEIKVLGWSLVLPETMDTGGRRCVCTRVTPPGAFCGKKFDRSDWPPVLCGRFGGLR